MILKFLAPGSFYGAKGLRWYKDLDGFSIPAEATGKLALPPYNDEDVTPLDADESLVLKWAAIVGHPESALVQALERQWRAEGLVFPDPKPAPVKQTPAQQFGNSFAELFKEIFHN